MNDSYTNPTPSHAIGSIQGQPEGAAMDASVKAWTGPKPMPDHPDEPTPAHWFWIELGPRIRRRPRCGEIVED